jgi:hypothetical protein
MLVFEIPAFAGMTLRAGIAEWVEMTKDLVLLA